VKKIRGMEEYDGVVCTEGLYMDKIVRAGSTYTLIKTKERERGKKYALIKLKREPQKLTSSCLPQWNLNQAMARYLKFVPWRQLFRIFHKGAYGI